MGGPDARVTVLPVQFSSDQTGPVQLPLFRVQDRATGAERFVDNQGRTYRSFDDWKENNQLPPGKMVYPSGGHLTPDVHLTTRTTPRTVDTPLEHVKGWIDDAALVGGVVAGGAVLLGSGGALAPVVLGAATTWQTFRSVESLDDRHRHGQSINPFTDEGARGEWLNLGAGALSLASLGATGLAGRLAQTGSRFGRPVSPFDVRTMRDATLYRHLDPSVQSAIAAQARSAGNDRALADLARSEHFRGLDVQQQQTFLRDLSNLSPDVRRAFHDSYPTAARLDAGDSGANAFSRLVGAPDFRQLPVAEQAATLRALGDIDGGARQTFYDEWALRPRDRGALLDVAQSGGFQVMGASTQRAVLRSLSGVPANTRELLAEQLPKHGARPADAETLGRLFSSRGFPVLDPAERERLLRYAYWAQQNRARPARRVRLRPEQHVRGLRRDVQAVFSGAGDAGRGGAAADHARALRDPRSPVRAATRAGARAPRSSLKRSPGAGERVRTRRSSPRCSASKPRRTEPAPEVEVRRPSALEPAREVHPTVGVIAV